MIKRFYKFVFFGVIFMTSFNRVYATCYMNTCGDNVSYSANNINNSTCTSTVVDDEQCEYSLSDDIGSNVHSIRNEIYDENQLYIDLMGEAGEVVNYTTATSSSYWWPIGSSTTTETNGVLFANGTPASTNVITSFDSVQDGVRHRGIDIASDNEAGVDNVVAVMSGVVVYPTSNSNISFGEGEAGSTDGDGYGNYVIIQHSDGTYSLYAHLYKDSITVTEGDSVAQGQVIGKVGNSGDTDRVQLHFEIRVGSNSQSSAEDPLNYISTDNTRPIASSTDGFSLVSTTLERSEFSKLMTDYCTSSGDTYFCNNFSANADLIYDVSVAHGVNPELVVVTAKTESGWRGCGTTKNYWGIGIPNGAKCEDGPTFSNLEEGIIAYANTLANYRVGGARAAAIEDTYNERLAAGCDPAGYGLPGTLEGMQSSYSWIGTYRYNPGDESLGGCYYLNGVMYADNYCSIVPTCTDYSNCSEESKTTTCEQSDYTAWQISGKVRIRFQIFGL